MLLFYILVLEMINCFLTMENENLALFPFSVFLIHALFLPFHLPASQYTYVLF